MEAEVLETSFGPMLTEAQQDVIRRLRCAEGHTLGVARMVESGSDCMAIVRQINAIQGALDKVARILLHEHLVTHIPDSNSRDDPGELIDEITELFALSRSI